ncbi:MAG: hypothetical protein IT324_30975 [Anaerolineae bacterium]|nr:hypothetical protein [Anaerolineae bacterium]
MIGSIFRFAARVFLMRVAFRVINRLFGGSPQTVQSTQRYNRSNMA